MIIDGLSNVLANLMVQPTLIERINISQSSDEGINKLNEEVTQRKHPRFRIHEDGFLKFGARLCVPGDEALKEEII